MNGLVNRILSADCRPPPPKQQQKLLPRTIDWATPGPRVLLSISEGVGGQTPPPRTPPPS